MKSLFIIRFSLFPYFTALLILFFCTSTLKVNAQFLPTAVKPDNTLIQSLTEKVEEHGWLYMKDDALLLEGELFSLYKTNMGLSGDDEMVITETSEDDYGYTHVRYQQYYKNIPVQYGDYTEHLNNCKICPWENCRAT